MEDLGWRRRRGSSPVARRGARQRAGLTPASASNTLSCQRETPKSDQPIKNPLDSDHGIYRDWKCKAELDNLKAELDKLRRPKNDERRLDELDRAWHVMMDAIQAIDGKNEPLVKQLL